MDRRRLRDRWDRVDQRVDRLAGRPGRALNSVVLWWYGIVPAVLGGLVTSIVLSLWALKVPPMALMIVPVLACSTAYVRYHWAQLTMQRAINRDAPPGSTRAQAEAVAAPFRTQVMLRSLQATNSIMWVFVALPVTFLLCVPWDVGYLVAAAITAPLIVLARWVLARSPSERARVLRHHDARTQHPEAFAHPGRLHDDGLHDDGLHDDGLHDDTGGTVPPVDLPVLLGAPRLPATVHLEVELSAANALVCHELGIYAVEATFPSGALRRSGALEPELDRRAVLALAASGELWRPERIKASSSWQDLAGWSVDDRELTLWSHDGVPFRWRHLWSSFDSRLTRESDAQLAAMTAALQQRLGPPLDR